MASLAPGALPVSPSARARCAVGAAGLPALLVRVQSTLASLSSGSALFPCPSLSAPTHGLLPPPSSLPDMPRPHSRCCKDLGPNDFNFFSGPKGRRSPAFRQGLGMACRLVTSGPVQGKERAEPARAGFKAWLCFSRLCGCRWASAEAVQGLWAVRSRKNAQAVTPGRAGEEAGCSGAGEGQPAGRPGGARERQRWSPQHRSGAPGRSGSGQGQVPPSDAR